MATDFAQLFKQIRQQFKTDAFSPLGWFVIGVSALVLLALILAETMVGNTLLGWLHQIGAWAKQPMGVVAFWLAVALLLWVAMWIGVAAVAAIVQTRPKWAGVKEERDELRKEVASLTRQRDTYHDQMVGANRVLNYGFEFPRFPALSEVDRGIAVNAALPLAADLHRVTEAADLVWRNELNAWSEVDSAFYVLHRWIQEHPHQHLRTSLIWLDRDIRTSLDPRPLLTVAYMAYHRWRMWMIRIHRLHAINADPRYAEWVELDEKFQAGFQGAIKHTHQFRAMAPLLTDFHETEGAVAPLPPLANRSVPD